MTPIERIIKTPLRFQPWNHKYLENVFDAEDLPYILESAKEISEKFKDLKGSKSIHFEDKSYPTSEKTIEIFNKFSDNLFKNKESILAQFNNNRRYRIYKKDAYWGVCNNQTYNTHPDTFDKALTMVVYLWPEIAVGTRLYIDDRLESYYSTAEWKPNNGILFAPHVFKTWHDFLHYGDQARVTINFYIKFKYEL